MSMDTNAGPSRDFIGYGRDAPSIEWPQKARLAISLVVNYEEGSEYNYPDGDNRNEIHGSTYPVPAHVRDLRLESIYEYGSRVGIWRILRIFEEHGVPVTFHAAALALERNPEVAAAIGELGHEPCSHGYRWEDPWNFSREEEGERIAMAVASIEKTVGERPVGWYTRYGPSIHTRELLVEEGGFVYDSDAYNDELPYFLSVKGERHLVLPYTGTFNDGRFVGIPRYSSVEDFVIDCTRAIQRLWQEGDTTPRMMTIGLHPRLVGDPARSDALHRILDHAQGLGDVWFARRVDIARWWIDRYAHLATVPLEEG
jgi:peptidoglycan/xylan/chitin deacetylase (PgdA/CDA1 family)